MTKDDFETTMDKSGTISSNPKSDQDSSKPVASIESSTSTANATTVATASVVTGPIHTSNGSKPVTNVPETAVATKTSKPATTNQNTTSPNKGGAGSISESKPKSGAELSKTIKKKESASNDALVSRNIERSTTTLTETSTVTSTSTQWTRTQTPSGATKYNEITEVRVQSAVDTKKITKEKSTLAITKSDNTTAESATNEKSASKSSHGSEVITTGVGLTLVPVDDSSSGTPQRKNSENEVQIVKTDGSMRVSLTKKESETETGSENDHPGNALKVILMTDDGNKKPEKSAKLEKSDNKSEKTSKKKKKKPLTDVKSPKMSKKDSKLVKKYNREYFKPIILKYEPSTFNSYPTSRRFFFQNSQNSDGIKFRFQNSNQNLWTVHFDFDSDNP